jgi:tetratricopeptide (TPR) repeat protein
MLNVPDLEKRWKRYRRKRLVPYYAAAGAITVAAFATLFYLYDFDTETQSNASANHYSSRTTLANTANTSSASSSIRPVQPIQAVASSQTVQTASSSSISVVTNTLPATASKKVGSAKPRSASSASRQTVKLAPSMAFMQDFESDVMQYYFDEPATSSSQSSSSASIATTGPSEKLPAISPRATVSSSPIQTDTVPKASTANPKVNRPANEASSKRMLIQRDNDMKDIQDVIARFKKNKNPALSLFVAKRYYRIGNYQQAYNYALMTNELDSGIEDSWLIFAKSLYKLDQKEMAIKTLKTYYEESGSVKAKITIDQMEKGLVE